MLCMLQGPSMVQIPVDIPRLPLPPCLGPSSGSASDKYTPFPTSLLTPLLMPKSRNRGASPEWGTAGSDLSGCDKCQTQLKWQKELVRALRGGDGKTEMAARSRWKGHCPLQLCVTQALLPVPALLGAATAHRHWRKKSQKPTFQPQIKSGQMSSELPHQSHQRRDFSPVQIQTTTRSPKWSWNLHLGHSPGSGHAVSTCPGEEWMWGV